MTQTHFPLHHAEAFAMNIIQPITCDNCGKCCMYMGSPPHMVSWDDGQPSGPMSDDYTEDWDWLMSAPEEAIRLYRERLYDDDAIDGAPCVWLDLETRRCRFYEHRPGICRDFELGGEDCLAVRAADQLEAS